MKPFVAPFVVLCLLSMRPASALADTIYNVDVSGIALPSMDTVSVTGTITIDATNTLSSSDLTAHDSASPTAVPLPIASFPGFGVDWKWDTTSFPDLFFLPIGSGSNTSYARWEDDGTIAGYHSVFNLPSTPFAVFPINPYITITFDGPSGLADTVSFSYLIVQGFHVGTQTVPEPLPYVGVISMAVMAGGVVAFRKRFKKSA